MTDHVVLVTGSSSGIGAAVAQAFGALGSGVVVNSARSVAEGEAVAAALPDACYVQGDICDPAAAQRMVAAARERWGRLDTLVNNAGPPPSSPTTIWRRRPSTCGAASSRSTSSAPGP